jgi:hypothetical protein
VILPFAGVHGGVGQIEQPFGVRRIVRKRGQPGAEGDGRNRSAELESRPSDGIGEFFQELRGVNFGDAGHQNTKLFT